MRNKFLLIFSPLFLSALEFPLEFNGRVFLGKYLNSDTIRYNLDASAQLRCTMIKHNEFSFYMEYRDDLDMAEQKGGVSLDPRYSHYFVIAGIEYYFSKLFGQLSFIHDCIHDIDYEVEGTPVFNRLSLLISNADYHPTRVITTQQKLFWALGSKFYPHIKYHGWDINSGADYQYEFTINFACKVWSNKNFGVLVNPELGICQGDTSLYHQHAIRGMVFYKNNGSRIGLEMKYNIYNNDPIKNPGGLWLLSIFVEF